MAFHANHLQVMNFVLCLLEIHTEFRYLYLKSTGFCYLIFPLRCKTLVDDVMKMVDT